MRDLIRLIIIILFLPLIVVFIGPLLVLAALRGHQGAGPITLNAARYGTMGRLGIFLLGASIWLLVWSGLGWLALEAVTPVPLEVALPTPTPAVNVDAVAAESSSAVTPSQPVATPTLLPTATATPLPPAPTATDTATVTPQPTDPATASPTPDPTDTPTAEPIPTDTPTATSTSTSTVTPTAEFPVAPPTLGPIVRPTVALADRRAAIVAVREANDLLRDAIVQASEDNLSNLGEVWQGKAFTVIESFALEMNTRYTQPLVVDYKYSTPPVISEQSVPNQIIVITREEWSYGGPSELNQETFEFIYTLTPSDDRWVISRYSFRNLPTPTATPTATPPIIPTLEY